MRSKFLLLNMYVDFCISDLSDPLLELAHTNCVPLLQALCSVASNGPWREYSYHENQETWQTGLFHWGSRLFFIFLHTASPGSLMMLTPGILSGSLSSPRRGPCAGNQGLRLITHWATCWVAFIVSNSSTLYSTAHQAPLLKGFSRQEYWSGLPCPSPDLPNPGIEPGLPHYRQILHCLRHQGSPPSWQSALIFQPRERAFCEWTLQAPVRSPQLTPQRTKSILSHRTVSTYRQLMSTWKGWDVRQ